MERSVGSSCYLRCYIIETFAESREFDCIVFQSPSLDGVFKYKYNYLDLVREGINLGESTKDVYKIPFLMDAEKYQLIYRMGQDNCLGLLEDFDRKGEILIPLQKKDIKEVYNISLVLQRLSMFMTSRSSVPFKKITLYKMDLKIGQFFSPFVLCDAVSVDDMKYYELDVMKYIPKILNNIAQDSENKITQSVPLGHLGNIDSIFSPQRFMEQVMAFEYLFQKLEPGKADNRKFGLKKELKLMLKVFPELLTGTKITAEEISERIKNIRHAIAHGHAYYYDFKQDPKDRYMMILLDNLIRKMSLKWMLFSEEEIEEYPVY